VLREWAASGKTITAFARSIGVVPQRLFWWRTRLGESGGSSTALTFAPVHVRAQAAGACRAPVLVTTPAGAQIEVGEIDAATAAWVVAVLDGEARR
jgi:transposase-like protein